MKKVILGMVFIAIAMTSININAKEDEQDCLQAAWRYGTQEGGGNPDSEYFYMVVYAELFCD